MIEVILDNTLEYNIKQLKANSHLEKELEKMSNKSMYYKYF